MRQEAMLAVWRTQKQGAGYAYKSAVNAVLAWRLKFVGGWARHDKPPRPTPQGTCTAFEDWMHVSDFQEDDLDGLDDNLIWKLAIEFLAARKKQGERGIRAAARDARIVQLITLGYNTRGIAQEMGMKEGTVKRYRSEIRKRLRGMLQ